MTYKELYNSIVKRLELAGIDEAESDTRLLFYYILGMERADLVMKARDEAADDEVKRILDAVDVRETRVPLQHITGKQNFMGLEFNVTPDVLIPRFDTECLVEETMLVCNDGDKVLDVCTGSGCILISLMKYKNDITGIGCDISRAALEVAEKNAREMLLNPLFVESDLFENVLEGDFDIIVSNPPYIRSEVIDSLAPEVKEHDPMLALDGGEDGLIFYRRLTKEAHSYLKKGGWLLVEIGYDQGEDVKELFCINGFKDVEIIKDLAGFERIVKGKLIQTERFLCLTD